MGFRISGLGFRALVSNFGGGVYIWIQAYVDIQPQQWRIKWDKESTKLTLGVYSVVIIGHRRFFVGLWVRGRKDPKLPSGNLLYFRFHDLCIALVSLGLSLDLRPLTLCDSVILLNPK